MHTTAQAAFKRILECIASEKRSLFADVAAVENVLNNSPGNISPGEFIPLDRADLLVLDLVRKLEERVALLESKEVPVEKSDDGRWKVCDSVVTNIDNMSEISPHKLQHPNTVASDKNNHIIEVGDFIKVILVPHPYEYMAGALGEVQDRNWCGGKWMLKVKIQDGSYRGMWNIPAKDVVVLEVPNASQSPT